MTTIETTAVSRWTELAEQHWKSELTGARRVRPEVIKVQIWDELEKDGFNNHDLTDLENLQLLERYLWPGYNEASSDHHILLIAIMVKIKRREGLPVWELFQSNTNGFSSLFRRILSMSVDGSVSLLLQNHILAFLLAAFQSLEVGIVRKECASIVSISIWHHLHNENARETRFRDHALMRKAWRAALRRFEAADETTRARLVFERSWIYTKMVDFMDKLYTLEIWGSAGVAYCERFMELLTDLESQLPTRRYVNSLIQDLNLLAVIKQSPVYENPDNGFFRDLYNLLRHFVEFPIDDETGTQYSPEDIQNLQSASLARLQRLALKSYKNKLTLLALSNYGVLSQRKELETHFGGLGEKEIFNLATGLGFRTTYLDCKSLKVDRSLIQEILVSSYEKPRSFQDRVASMNLTPTEVDLYDPSLLRNESYDGLHSLAIPKLNLQYLTIGDFLWRSFVLYRCETFFDIRKDMEDIIERMQPRIDTNGGGVRFSGTSRMALPITRPAILEVSAPRVGQDVPAYVKTEITLNVAKLGTNVLSEWDSLRPGDVVYLLSVKPGDRDRSMLNGHTDLEALKQTDLRHLRTAEVVQTQNEDGRLVKDMKSKFEEDDEYIRRPRVRRLIVHVDAVAYAEDQITKAQGKRDIYDSINLVVRRKARENNFRPILESIKKLILLDVPIPAWLQEVFLGFGDPSSASYNNLPEKIASLDLRDTFLDWQHLIDSLPGKNIEPDLAQASPPTPPYVLESTSAGAPAIQQHTSRKRRRDDKGSAAAVEEVIKVTTYQPATTGPYSSDLPKKNHIRFTPAQTEAIISGTQPGLTVVVGPPGTGKTDVAAQIINNLYHDFPEQRTLLIAHSNQALNQLFQKITNLDIDGRHLLRLGHGEEDLETEVSYGKQGRVESFLDNRFALLSEVDRLAAVLSAPGAHGNSCETAGYFRSVYVDPTWAKFWTTMKDGSVRETIKSSFPFFHYFSNAPQPLFPEDATDDQLVEIVKGCERHISKIFTELQDIRPFELLRSPRDRANYLLIKEARIIAMTSTHAAMRRQEIAELGFHYDNVVMEEAAQITEIENFIPLALQHPKDGKLPLKRVVLCGDHYQNSPVIQNLAFRQFANLEQSMFLRFIRLGVPVVNLDKQGRARPTIADLYRWRYKHLGDLPNVTRDPEYLQANAGFRHDWQFIDVGDYKGQGEMQPTPHFIQNLGEAEYAVAIFQYMRLLGYPAQKISILTTYAGQRALVRDVLNHRCSRNKLFGMPRHVTTVDKYQGEQNDYVILSLVRSSRVGYLRDIRRMTVALSRARLGLYILGRKEVFGSCFELREVFARLFQRTTTLQVVTGEQFPTQRKVGDESESTEMTGVEHLGQYVYEMTQAKMKQLNGAVPLIANEQVEGLLEETEGDRENSQKPEDLEDLSELG